MHRSKYNAKQLWYVKIFENTIKQRVEALTGTFFEQHIKCGKVYICSLLLFDCSHIASFAIFTIAKCDKIYPHRNSFETNISPRRYVFDEILRLKYLHLYISKSFIRECFLSFSYFINIYIYYIFFHLNAWILVLFFVYSFLSIYRFW